MNTNENDFNMKMKHGLRDDANGEIRQGLCEFIEEILIVTTLKEEIEIYFKSTLLLRLGYEGNFGYRTVDSILKLL